MKYTTVLLSLLAVATAVSVPNYDGPNVKAVDARKVADDEYGTSNGGGPANALEARRRTHHYFGNNNNKTTNQTSDASDLVSLAVGVLVTTFSLVRQTQLEVMFFKAYPRQ
ncbi:hypothetical protein NEMBOFW57_000122 [Staphylotrichum longicolle]|uniref:RxLR effector protein n=1 Tax=Staphylotrichum longicolle TaxID=669026 RepID=A0AAD4EZA4_9PEZI|nr:hypothetical protein NEMBOFW57_000122 [Staphylotrichum longicolle]